MENPTSGGDPFGERVVAVFAFVVLFGVVVFWVGLRGEDGERANGPEVRAAIARREVPVGPSPEVETSAKARWGSLFVDGRVVDERGRALESAGVRLALESGGRVTPLASLATDDTGRFRHRAPEAAELSSLRQAGARLRVRAWKSGYAWTEAVHDLADAGTSLTVELALPLGGSLTGRVVDPRGEAVGGAAVRLVPHDFEEAAHVWPSEAESDADGVFQFGLTGSSFFDLEAFAAGVGHAAVRGLQLDPAKSNQVQDLVLEERSALAGVVRYPDGAPATGVELTARFQGDPAQAGEGTDLSHARTDEEGRFGLVGLRRGPYLVGYADALLGPAPDDPVESGRDDLELVLDAYRLLVAVTENGHDPFPGLLVRCHPLRERPDGGFEPAAVGWGSFDVAQTETADAMAAFVVEPGRIYAARVDAGGGAFAEEVVRIEPPRHETRVGLSLAPVRSRGRLSVRLVDGLGRDLEPFWVGLSSPLTRLPVGSRLVASPTDRELFVPEGVFDVVLRTVRSEEQTDPGFLAPARTRSPIEVRAGSPVRLQLVAREGGRLSLRYDSPAVASGGGSRTIRVWARPDDGSAPIPVDFFVYGEGYALTHGKLRYGEENLSRTVLEPGDYRVLIETEDEHELDLPARVHAGEVTEVGLPL